MSRRIGLRLVLGLAVVAAWASAPAVSHAQQGQTAGVYIDADRVLHVRVFNDPTGQLAKQRVEDAKSKLKPDVLAKNICRKISLNRLEKALAERIAQGLKPTEEMLNLVGLLRLQYVFYYPVTKDIVIAGPAEGWAADLSGRVRGITTGRPVVELQDLVVALRAYPPGKERGPVIGCSIDPTKEGLAALQTYLKQFGGQIAPNADTESIVTGMRSSLGYQTVRVLGVPPDTHFAQVLVEADYRMKLIGIGLERPPVKMSSYVDQANPAQVSRNAMQRWYFTPDYQCVKVSEDDMAMELVGQGVKLVNADELVNADGTRAQSSGADRASRSFVNGFTKKYPELAARMPVYAQLRNLIDLAVAAAFIQEKDYYGQAGWTMATLGSEEKYAVQVHPTPVQVESAVNAIWKGSQLMLPIGGGVNVQAVQALSAENLLKDEKGEVAKQRSEISLDQLKDGQWWWD